MEAKKKELIDFLESTIEFLKNKNVVVDDYYTNMNSGIAQRNNGYMMENGPNGDVSIELKICTQNHKVLNDFILFKDKETKTTSEV